MIGTRLFLTMALCVAAASPAAALEHFAYCGTVQITGLPKSPQLPPQAAGFLAPIPVQGLYVGPTGATPVAPESCAYVTLGKAKDGYHVPEIVVWSDVPPPIAYHADIYSDAQGIFGHRQDQPSDYEPSGIDERTREMEAYLDAAAGEPVLQAVLAALREGRDRAELERELPVPLPAGAGATVTMPVRYELTDIRTLAVMPERIERFRAEARQRRHPHSRDWKPIRIPVEAVR